MLRILLVCTGNTCRSPMARALLWQHLQTRREGAAGGEIQVWSAGLFTQDGMPASPEAVKAMHREGIDISSHRSLQVSNHMVEEADLILTMTVSQRDYLMERYPHKSVNIFTLSEFAGDDRGEVMDPYGQGQEAYQKSLQQLQRLVDMLVHKITEV